jgi:DHA1 family multidrug resistance protein-like MFS transporter
LIAAVFISSTGFGSVLPILPIFLRERGASYSMVGIIVGAAVIGQLIGQYPAGWLSDRIGRRTIMVAGLVIAGAGNALFAIPAPIWVLIALRVVQGLGTGAFRPGARATIADLVPPSERGVAYGWFSAASLSGFITGPALGGLLVAAGRSAVFLATGIATLIAAVVVAAALRDGVERALPEPVGTETGLGISWRNAGLRAVVILSLGTFFLIGVYDVVWSLFMKSIRATDLQVGLSFSLFALPLVIVTPLAGWAADHWDRRWTIVASTLGFGLIAPIYPFFPSIPLVITIGVVEAVVAAFSEPATNGLLMDSVPASVRGSAAGIAGMAEGVGMSVGAFAGGTLFGLGVAVPFRVMGVVCVGAALASIPSLLESGKGRRVGGRARMPDDG